MSLYDHKFTLANGNEVQMNQYENKSILIVNTASACGFTNQYSGLQSLYEKYEPMGFVVLAFPCNQFGEQEKGSEEEIMNFCNTNYNVGFPIASKVSVNGPTTHPLYTHLKQEQPGLLGSQNIKWNFTKFLVDKTGKVIKRYSPQTKPESIEQDIVQTLNL